MVRPVFFDPTGRRRRRTRLILGALLALLLLGCAVFATTVANVPVPSPLPIGYERLAPLPFRAQVTRLKHRIGHFFHAGRVSPPTASPAHPLTVAFYTSWTDDSTPSLQRHIDSIDWVAPTLLGLDAQAAEGAPWLLLDLDASTATWHRAPFDPAPARRRARRLGLA